MTDAAPARRLDLGRVVAVAFFSLLLVMNTGRLVLSGFLEEPLSTVTSVLTIAFYLMLLWAYLRRTPSDRTDRHPWAWTVALLGTASPFAIPLVSRGPSNGVTEWVGAAVMVVGLASILWAVGALGTNISMVPQAREAVTSGPYAVVRHPLYLAEIINVIGLCLVNDGPWPWLALVAMVFFQVLRARREEALLARELVGYDEYRRRTPMLLPIRLGRPADAVA